MIGPGSLIAARRELAGLGLHIVDIRIGEAEVLENLDQEQYLKLCLALRQNGLELIRNKLDILVQGIKSIIIDVIYNREEPLPYNLSVHLSAELEHDYTYMSNIFSERSHTTIEKFYICNKIERVKHLLLCEELTLTEIAYKMHYSSLAHLSSQFKKVTGLTTTQFKKQNHPETLV